MKSLKLDILALIPQKVHHHFQIRLAGNVPRHDIVIGAVQEDLAEELEGLALGDVVGGEDEGVVHVEELWSQYRDRGSRVEEVGW